MLYARALAVVFVSIGLGLAASAVAQSVGDVLPPGPAGGMDIHHINTGEGNAGFFILPDGTTMLVDCGDGFDIKRPPKYKAPRRPDESRTPGEWVARYIKKFHPDGEKGAVDYLVISHFHSDHMGGIPDVAQHVRFGKILDRAWPDYGEPRPFTSGLAQRYRAALDAQVAKHGASVERFKVGAANQIVLRRAPERFPDFEVRNLAANAVVWTGQGDEVRSRYPADEKPDENACSMAMRVRFGRFDYFTGGDLPGGVGEVLEPASGNMPARLRSPVWRDVESAVAWVTGPVDALLLNHHGNSDSSNAFFLSVLQPRICISNIWATPQIDVEALARLKSEDLYPGPRDIFATNGLWDGRREHLLERYRGEVGSRHIAELEKLTASQGHVVIRVAPGGKTYTVFILDDSAESFRIRSIHAGYESR